MKKSSWFIFLVLFVVSCLDEPDCFQLNNNVLGIAFRVIGSTKADTTMLTAIDVGAMGGLIQGDTLPAFLLPINYLADNMTIKFQGPGPNVINDQLLLRYRVQTQFVSEDCGSRFIISDIQVPSSTFDSIRVVNSVPTKTGTLNVEIYRCPNPKRVGVVFRELYVNGPNIVRANKTSRVIGADINSVTDGSSTIVYNNGAAATVYLPLDTATNQSSYTFNFKDNRYAPADKKLVLSYERNVRSVDEKKCPAKTYFTKMKVGGTTTFDSVSFVVSTSTTTGLRDTMNHVTDPIEPNIYVYRCPQTNLFQIAFKRRTSSGSTRVDTVGIQSITVDYNSTQFHAQTRLSYAQVPLNPNADQTVITVNYLDGRAATIFTVGYARRNTVLFTRCGDQQRTYGKLVLINNPSPGSLSILTATDSVRFPPVSNLEITR